MTRANPRPAPAAPRQLLSALLALELLACTADKKHTIVCQIYDDAEVVGWVAYETDRGPGTAAGYCEQESPEADYCTCSALPRDLSPTSAAGTGGVTAGGTGGSGTGVLPACACDTSLVSNGFCDPSCRLPECGNDGGDCPLSPTFMVQAGGFVTTETWAGYAWTAAVTSPATVTQGTTIDPPDEVDFTNLLDGDFLCASGSVGAATDHGGVALLGINLAQAYFPPNLPQLWTPTGSGLRYGIDNYDASPLRLQIMDATNSESGRWCITLTELHGTIPWSSFRTQCWTAGGTPYDGLTPLQSVAVLVPGGAVADVPFDFCIEELGVY